jgi:hypothetical protein
VETAAKATPLAASAANRTQCAIEKSFLIRITFQGLTTSGEHFGCRKQKAGAAATGSDRGPKSLPQPEVAAAGVSRLKRPAEGDVRARL